MNHTKPIQLAFVRGGHPFDVPAFRDLFGAMKSMDFYIQSLDEFTYAADKVKIYDTVLFYNMHTLQPSDDLPWNFKRVFSTLETELGQNSQRMVILHHALLAFPQWPFWSEMVGNSTCSFGFHFGAPVRKIVDADHPILNRNRQRNSAYH